MVPGGGAPAILVVFVAAFIIRITSNLSAQLSIEIEIRHISPSDGHLMSTACTCSDIFAGVDSPNHLMTWPPTWKSVPPASAIDWRFSSFT